MNCISGRLVAVLCLLVGVATAAADADLSPGEQLAERYGLSAWPDVRRIEFTFVAELPDGRRVERPWAWEPQVGKVVAQAGTAEAHAFDLNDLQPQDRDAHGRFINDTYWLLFPFQLVWSTCEVTDEGEAVSPIGQTPTRKLTVTYPDEGGYTPGDVYELFIDQETGLIAEWNFRRGGGDIGMPARWLQHETLDGITFSLDHRGPDDGGFRLMFPRVFVETADETAEVIWSPAEDTPVRVEIEPR
jgi:hypothetical protein